jgi:hypothetical protein
VQFFKYILFIYLGFVQNKYLAQNLLLNGGFDSYTNPVDCNGGGGFYNITTPFPYVHVVNNWEIYNSPDYFHDTCNNNYFDVPVNYLGYSFPKSGNAYAGIIAFIGSGTEVKEYIYQQLSTPLDAGKNYCLSFYISRADGSTGAIKNIGAYFSNTLPGMVSFSYINAVPQVQNQNGFITDTTNWVQIQGCFTATGGEQYVTIGNFNSNANTDTLYTGSTFTVSGTNPPYYTYYYLDDINLYDPLTVGVNELNVSHKFNLFPNPNNGTMELNYDLGKDSEATMRLYDVTGNLVNAYKLVNTKGTMPMNEQALHNGIYFYHILVGEKIIKTDKIVIIK